jgi:hypothetical protein
LGCGFALGCLRGTNAVIESDVAVGWIASIFWVIVIPLLLLIILNVICLLVGENRILRKQILFTAVQGDDARFDVSAALTLFIMVMLTTVLWYGLRYDPTGTFKPDWTNKLG